MTRTVTTLFIITSFLLAVPGASHAQNAAVTGPHLLVYKTKPAYRKLVPVTLTADGKGIANYPDPKDIKAGGAHMRPTALHEGYSLDNRGISEHSAFLVMSYDTYGNLKTTPTIDELKKMIVAKDPIVTLCDCGPRNAFKNPVADINKLIDKGTLLKTCKVIKKGRSHK